MYRENIRAKNRIGAKIMQNPPFCADALGA